MNNNQLLKTVNAKNNLRKENLIGLAISAVILNALMIAMVILTTN